MSFRSKRSRQAHLSKVKDTTSQSVQDVVAEVIRDVADSEDEDADNLPISCLNGGTNSAATTQPTCTTNEADDLRSIERNASGRQSLTPTPSHSLFPGSHRLRTVQGQSSRIQHSDDQLKHVSGSVGAFGEDTELGCGGNNWTNDTMVEPTQCTAMGTEDFRPSQLNTAVRKSRSPPPSGSFLADTSNELRHLQRPPTWLQENDGEPAEHGRSEARHSKSSKWSSGVGFDNMEDMEIYEEPVLYGPSLARNSKPAKWSNDLQFDDMEEVEMRDSKGKRGKKGGSILPRHVWSLRSGVRFVVPFNSLDQPVRKGGSVLIRFLGDIAKVGELCPIDEVNWTKVDKSYKANIIALVREKFITPDRPEIDKRILKHVGNRWKGYRHDLKLEYKIPGKTQEQVASIVPKGVIPSQWEKLVQYWFSDNCKMLSKNGKESRASVIHLHAGVAKSFAQKRDEFEMAHGREPGATEWFNGSHKRKDGMIVENSSKEFVETAAPLIAQRGSASSSQRAVENQGFNELMYADDAKLYQRPVEYGFGSNRKKVFEVELESRKRGYLSSGVKKETGSSKKKLFRGGTEERDNGYMPQDWSAEVERLNFAMIAMGETNELMRGQIKMQSQQLQMQSQQLQMQSKQIEGLQQQMQQVTSLLTKFGSMLNNPRVSPTPTGVPLQGFNGTNRPFLKVAEPSSDYSDAESDSSDWGSDQ